MTIVFFYPATETHRNPRKHRRLDDDPSDGGGGDHMAKSDQPVVGAFTTAPSYKESLVKDNTVGDQVDVDFLDDEGIDL
ncbi:hypothetical protein V6N12_076333 [Hibiscus sabdariffa]|uniref:Uncharacterized protein n=1 Tax=Hibiscus sabdariffa TaxID=183260 RepID=A0ABR2D9I1_9ROSI